MAVLTWTENTEYVGDVATLSQIRARVQTTLERLENNRETADIVYALLKRLDAELKRDELLVSEILDRDANDKSGRATTT